MDIAEEKKEKLTDKMEQFSQEYIIDFNATQAAIKSGYSEKTAQQMGSENLSKPVIRKRINALLVEKMGTEREELQARTIKELKAIAFSQVTDDINIITKEVEVPILDKDGKPTGENQTKKYQTIEITDTENSPNKRAIASIKQNDKGVIEVKYHDKVKALERIGQHVDLWEDNAVSITNITIGAPPKPEEAEFPEADK